MVHCDDVLKVCVLVLRDDVAEHALLSWMGEVDRDELVLRGVLVREQVQLRSVIGDAGSPSIRDPYEYNRYSRPRCTH